MRPAEDLLVHRPPMLLLDAVLDHRRDGILARARVDPGAWYADARGAMPAWFGLELMAQAIAAYGGLNRRAQDREPRLGYLLGTRAYTCTLPAFPAGSELGIHAELKYLDDSGLSAFACGITLDGEEVATAILKTFEGERP
ncbi:ApeP family dehydratase [Mesoterricola silvestris]|uniref:3-hydroxylacyl-ACP dehydratase n=1 Tax=Mesoterricola silvestris TaxID=2927979 RepID=A0AA48GTG1_9BACT|nr:3-hydroxy-fatty acyl-ACP dehydratase [Mesoterricola silvestris]BDU71446.1 3-hydroxylacyl-ACP dehydratase [Mesoterricola silvestris]